MLDGLKLPLTSAVRVLLVLMFILSGVDKLMHSQGNTAFIANGGLPAWSALTLALFTLAACWWSRRRAQDRQGLAAGAARVDQRAVFASTGPTVNGGEPPAAHDADQRFQGITRQGITLKIMFRTVLASLQVAVSVTSRAAGTPDSRITSHPLAFGSGERAAATGVLEATFSVPMKLPDGTSMAPTGTKVKMSMATTATWKNGCIAEEQRFRDNAEYTNQLGLAK